jgi:hypothetical protein
MNKEKTATSDPLLNQSCSLRIAAYIKRFDTKAQVLLYGIYNRFVFQGAWEYGVWVLNLISAIHGGNALRYTHIAAKCARNKNRSITKQVERWSRVLQTCS